MFYDRVGWSVAGVVVRCSSAGLHKQFSVADCRRGLYLHVDLAPHVKLQRIGAGVDHGGETPAVEELKLVGERTEALLLDRDVASVHGVTQGHVASLGVLAGDLHLQQVLAGDDIIDAINGSDCIFEDKVLVSLLCAGHTCLV